MRSIERRFIQQQCKQQDLSTLLNFGAAIRGQAFSTGMIHRWFNRLVDKDDYGRGEKRAVLRGLVALSCAEDNRNKAQKAR